MSETTYYQRNEKVMLNRTKEYYENSKEVFSEKQEINKDNYHKMKKI